MEPVLLAGRAGSDSRAGHDRIRARALRKRFSDLQAARMVIEVGTPSPWVQRLLQELGHETITAHWERTGIKVRISGV